MHALNMRDEVAVGIFESIRSRVNSISLAHKKLYQETTNLTFIEMQDYMHELIGCLRDCISTRPSIAFQLDIQALVLDVAQCVPLGLILTEAITNAMKYAFHDDNTPKPMISISLKEEPGHHISLVISDNGAGLPKDFDPRSSTSLGFQLIQALSDQLDACLDIKSDKGLMISIDFLWAGPVTR
jgi:two-component sensor histidine kinase